MIADQTLASARPFHRASRVAQRGVVLFISLIVLVAMSLAGIALVRSVDTGVLIAGNLTFKQGTTLAGDSGIEAARAALTALSSSGAANPLWSNSAGQAYFASLPSPEPDFVGTDSAKTAYNWTSTTSGVPNSIVVSPAIPGTTEVRYVIHRLCTAAGDPAATSCVRGAGTAATSQSQAVRSTGGGQNFTLASAQYYRITTRVIGPRNTRSFVEVIVN